MHCSAPHAFNVGCMNCRWNVGFCCKAALLLLCVVLVVSDLLGGTGSLYNTPLVAAFLYRLWHIKNLL